MPRRVSRRVIVAVVEEADLAVKIGNWFKAREATQFVTQLLEAYGEVYALVLDCTNCTPAKIDMFKHEGRIIMDWLGCHQALYLALSEPVVEEDEEDRLMREVKAMLGK